MSAHPQLSTIQEQIYGLDKISILACELHLSWEAGQVDSQGGQTLGLLRAITAFHETEDSQVFPRWSFTQARGNKWFQH